MGCGKEVSLQVGWVVEELSCAGPGRGGGQCPALSCLGRGRDRLLATCISPVEPIICLICAGGGLGLELVCYASCAVCSEEGTVD